MNYYERMKEARARIKLITAEICAESNIHPSDILGPSRARKVSIPRQKLYWRAKEETGLGRPLLGTLIGRDPQTIYHGIRAHEWRMAKQKRMEAGQ